MALLKVTDLSVNYGVIQAVKRSTLKSTLARLSL